MEILLQLLDELDDLAAAMRMAGPVVVITVCGLAGLALATATYL